MKLPYIIIFSLALCHNVLPRFELTREPSFKERFEEFKKEAIKFKNHATARIQENLQQHEPLLDSVKETLQASLSYIVAGIAILTACWQTYKRRLNEKRVQTLEEEKRQRLQQIKGLGSTSKVQPITQNTSKKLADDVKRFRKEKSQQYHQY
jgi:hypothetical protein